MIKLSHKKIIRKQFLENYYIDRYFKKEEVKFCDPFREKYKNGKYIYPGWISVATSHSTYSQNRLHGVNILKQIISSEIRFYKNGNIFGQVKNITCE